MLKLTFISDTHHYSKTLGTTGRQYFLRSGSDQKCLAETGEIIDSAFDKIAKSDTDAVMIIGDVTNDGEKYLTLNLKKSLKILQSTSRFTSSHQLTIGAVMKTQEDFRVTL